MVSPNPKVILNIGGQKFETSLSTVLQAPPTSLLVTRLGNQSLNSDLEVFFDRDWMYFRFILNYLRMGKDAILPDSYMGLIELLMEAKFYGLKDLVDICDARVKWMKTKKDNVFAAGSGGCKANAFDRMFMA